MNKLKIILLSAVISVLFSSCSDPLGIEDNLKISSVYSNMLPMAIGNYWIYDVNRNNIHYIDSMVITDSKTLDGMKIFEFSTYRNGVFVEKSFFSQTNEKILLYSQILEPLIDTLNCSGENNFNYRWIQIGRLGKIGSTSQPAWSVTDTSESYNYQVKYETDGEEKFEMIDAYNVLDIDFQLNTQTKTEGHIPQDEGNSTGKFAEYSITGRWIFELDTNALSRLKGNRYTLGSNAIGSMDDNTYLIQNLNLNIIFRENIGIIFTSGTTSCSSNSLFQERRLLRYKIR